MGKRLLFLMETLILFSCITIFGALTATTYQNDRIRDVTEDFAETVRYKGCITRSMYEELLKGIPTTVQVNFEIEKHHDLVAVDQPYNMRFTKDVTDMLYDTTQLYPLEVGDEFTVTVRKVSPTMLDALVGSLTGEGTTEYPLIAVKGGMILNEQYH